MRDIYKALTAIAERCQAIHHDEMVLEKTFETVTGMFNLKDVPEAVIMSLPTVINQTVQKVEAGYNERLNAIRQYDFGAVFEHYLRG